MESVFPTRVGVNRKRTLTVYDVYVFPTRVGVNLVCRTLKAGSLGFPHARGGEPPRPRNPFYDMLFSPRAWG
mgnify:CR=1 FL=1